MRGSVMIIGGGIAGLTTAYELAISGFEVHIIEQEPHIGGHALLSCCKGIDYECQKCGACFVDQKIEEVENHPNIYTYCRHKVEGTRKKKESILVQIKDDTKKYTTLELEAVVLATGFELYNAENKPQFGYRHYPGIYTGLDLEEVLRRHGSFSNAIPGRDIIKKIGFIQCVGSREEKGSAGDFCSRVCCMYSIRIARLLRKDFPKAEIDFYYLDLQTFGKGFINFKHNCIEKEKINFIYGLPSKIYKEPEEGLKAVHESEIDGQTRERCYDFIFLAAGKRPASQNEELASLFGLKLNENGFFDRADPFKPGYTHADGIFAVGTCHGPKDIENTMTEAKAVALRVGDYLRRKISAS